MNIIKIIFAVSVMSLPVQAQDAETLPPLGEIIIDQQMLDAAYVKVENYFNTVTSLKASFQQLNPNGSVARGNMILERPGKIRFDYADDYPYLIVSDGRILSLVDFEIGKVSKWPIEDTPLKMLLGTGVDLAALGARVEPNPDGALGYIAVTAGNPEKREQGEITIYFKESLTTAGLLTLDRWRVLDGQGKITLVMLRDQETNADFDASSWKYEDPRGSAKRNKAKRR